MILKRILIYEGDQNWIEATLKYSHVHDFVHICPKGKIYEAGLEELDHAPEEVVRRDE